MATGGFDYRSGALDRLGEASILLRNGRFGGSVYLAGRAVEGMLRAVIWDNDREYALGKRTLDTGHDLRAMLKRIRNLGTLRNPEIASSITEPVQKIARLWWNNMRFLSTRKIQTTWYNLGEINKGDRTMKQASQDFFDACATVVKQCEATWQEST